MLNPQHTNIIYHGIVTQQSYEAFNTVETVLGHYKPEVIIEIGTARGGFSMYLCGWAFINGAQLHTFDIAEHANEKTLRYIDRLGGQSYILDVFSTAGRMLIENIIKQDKKVLLFCDGGNKTKELVYFNKLMKQGDIIGCHDWGTEVATGVMLPYMARNGFKPITCGDRSLHQYWETL